MYVNFGTNFQKIKCAAFYEQGNLKFSSHFSADYFIPVLLLLPTILGIKSAVCDAIVAFKYKLCSMARHCDLFAKTCSFQLKYIFVFSIGAVLTLDIKLLWILSYFQMCFMSATSEIFSLFNSDSCFDWRNVRFVNFVTILFIQNRPYKKLWSNKVHKVIITCQTCMFVMTCTLENDLTQHLFAFFLVSIPCWNFVKLLIYISSME